MNCAPIQSSPGRTRILTLALAAFTVATQPAAPGARWSFDSLAELGGVTNATHPSFTLAPGVRGQALVFDGYTTELLLPPAVAPSVGDRFTLSAWVAPQEYSWNLSAIINRQEDFKQGWFFGINHAGQLVGGLALDSGWQSCISTAALPLLKWSHVTLVAAASNSLKLYLDGELAGEIPLAGTPVPAATAPTCIGKTLTPLTPARTERKSSQAMKSRMYFDGLMDELEIRNDALTPAQVREAFQSTPVANRQPLQYRRMPSGGDEPRPFGAYYTKLKYAPGWDARWQGSDLPDVVVRFAGSPVKLVFWRGTGYIPGLVSENGIWMTDQSGEHFGTGECFEAMGDKQCRYSHVRIVENTPARAVIHWRYALASISHKIIKETETYPGDWMDEYWTAYPDGVVVRKQVLWSEYVKPGNYQFQETIFFNQPGTKPQDNVESEAITFMDLDGQRASYSWTNGIPKSFPEPKFKPIELVNFKSQYRPFSIHHPERVARPFSFGAVKGYSTFPCWNHWPVSQIASDGRQAQAPDKPSHSSLTVGSGNQQITEKFPDGSIRARALMGMTTQPIDSLLPLARSWNFPPPLTVRSIGFAAAGYDAYQRAYLVEKQSAAGREFACEIAATAAAPLANLCLLIKNWGAAPAAIQLNGKPVATAAAATGALTTLEGDDLIVWLRVMATNTVAVTVTPQ